MNGKFVFLHAILVPLIFSCMALADVNNKDPGLKSSTSTIEKMINLHPDPRVRKGLEEYIKTVDPSVYRDYGSVANGNGGIAGYFANKFESNSCFKNSARKFYKEIGIALKKKHPCPKDAEFSSDTNMYGCDSKLITIDDYTGRGEKSDIEEGWLLRLALKHANNNLPAALELIALCGHDDKEQGEFRYKDYSQDGLRDRDAKISEMQADLEHAKKEIEKAASNPNYDEEELRKYRNQVRGLPGSIQSSKEENYNSGAFFCPPAKSDFYIPGSLSEKANINADLSQKVKKIQGNGKNIIPAKHYHIYASAYMGCKLVQEGLTPLDAQLIQTTAARMYRGVRMCGTAQNLLAERDQLREQFNDFDNSKAAEAAAIKAVEVMIRKKIDCAGGSAKLNTADKTVCDLVSRFRLFDIKTIDGELVKKRVAAAYRRVDAAYLYNDWYFGGKVVAGQQLPCTDIRFKGPKDLMEPTKGIMGSLYQPKGWSRARYEAATKEVATWDVDFEWTVAQHSVGVKYGAQVCGNLPKKQNPFAQPSCSTPDGPKGDEQSSKEETKKGMN